jgi:sec-independent protein translocase protein TatA
LGRRKGGGLLAIFQGIGAPELIIILVILLLLFGARRLPEIARSVGKSTKEYKAGMKEGASDEEQEAAAEKTPPETGSKTT